MPLIHRLLGVKQSFPAIETVDQVGVPATLMRGGTSRAAFFHAGDLPEDKSLWDAVFVSAIGSYEPKHIDGLGGTLSQSSKIAVISRSEKQGVDVDYSFSQVRPYGPSVDHEGNCGNISAAVGPFAIEEGLVEPEEPITTVKILNTNTNKLIISEVPVKNGQVISSGDLEIAGIAGRGAPIKLTFTEPGGAITGRIFPTGNPRNELILEGTGRIEYSLVDVANPVVFVKAGDLGIKGTESPEEIDSKPGLLDLLERIRLGAAGRAGIVDRRGMVSDAVPKIAIVAEPADYVDTDGRPIKRSSVDLLVRVLSMKKAHKTCAITVAIATAAAAALDGTNVSEIARRRGEREEIVIGHPGGVVNVGIEASNGRVQWASVYRTARTIMKGILFIPKERLSARH